MTQEEKQILLVDLCAKLPYRVKCKIHYTLNNETTFGEDVDAEKNDTLVKIDVHTQSAYFDWYCDWLSIEDIRPYLRPMSSMSEKEKNIYEYNRNSNVEVVRMALFDWLNEHHFDYRGLIPMGLALEAPEDMYK